MSTINDVPVLDLRNITPDGIRSISEINCLFALIFPTDADEDTVNALENFQADCVSNLLYLPKDQRITVRDGMSELTELDFSEGKNIFITSGITFLSSIPENAEADIYADGIVYVSKRLKGKLDGVHFAAARSVKYLNFDVVKTVSGQFEIDLKMIDKIRYGTAYIVSGMAVIANDVTPEMIEEKNIMIFVSGLLQCPRLFASSPNVTSVGRMEFTD